MRTRKTSLTYRIAAVVLVPGQLLLYTPVAQAESASTGPEAAPEKVDVRRGPAPRPVDMRLRISEAPSAAEISAARVFEEPLVPLGGEPTMSENSALGVAIAAYARGASAENLFVFEAFLRRHPRSPWRASLLVNLANVYRRTGYFSRALRAYQEAWRLTQNDDSDEARPVADRALGELAHVTARIGDAQALEKLLSSVSSRAVRGASAERLAAARQDLWLMQNRPNERYRCGVVALVALLRQLDPTFRPDPKLQTVETGPEGLSLSEVRELASEAGSKLQAVRRAPGGAIAVPSIVRFKVGHFAALVGARDGRYLLNDPAFGGEIWVSARALDDEASGELLVPEGALPAGSVLLSDAQAAAIRGKGPTTDDNPEHEKECDGTTDCPESKCAGSGGSGGGGSGGLPTYRVHLMLVSLNITDTPVGYTPPRGPRVQFTASYNQRDSFQPQTFRYSNLGPQWTFNWLSYIEDDPTSAAGSVTHYVAGGGRETLLGFAAAGSDPWKGAYTRHRQTRALLRRVSAAAEPVRYEREAVDGSIEVYAQPDGSVAPPRKVFMTERIDPQGQKIQFGYDSSMRLTQVVDALGRVTTLSYEHPTDQWKITKVHDPFGRFATFEYDDAGRLERITDVIGMSGIFTYDGGDTITAMTTPYGTTHFALTVEGRRRYIEITDPLGGRERVEFTNYPAGLSAYDSVNSVPEEGAAVAGIRFSDQNDGRVWYRSTYYWGKAAMERAPGDYLKAVQYHWLHDDGQNITSGVLESVKKPLENRVWYIYPNQWAPTYTGDSDQPIRVGRVLDDGTSQVSFYEYNARGKMIKAVDPLGRETIHVYGTGSVPDADPVLGSGLDLLQIKQRNPAAASGYDLLASYTYNDRHQVLTATDASGQTTAYTYDPDTTHLLRVVTPPRDGLSEADRTTAFTYRADGYLASMTGPGSGAAVAAEYDAFGRVSQLTVADGYTVTVQYDNLDRPTRVTYPDGTFNETVYDKLDAVKRRDRIGRWTQTFYDALRRVTAVRDPAGRSTQQEWGGRGGACCEEGGDRLTKSVDPNGNVTTREYDLQGRLTKETRPSQAEYLYAYEASTSRLKSIRDPNGSLKVYTYNPDDTVAGIEYYEGPGIAETPNIGLEYDTWYSRVARVTDGTGAAVYEYYPVTEPPTLGAGKLKSVDGPWDGDRIEYGYDEMGRFVTRTIGALGRTETRVFDALGRYTALSNPLGTFTYTYEGATARRSSLRYPNGQETTYAYHDESADFRLRQIHNKMPNGATLSRFEYTYDAVGNVRTWLQQAGAEPARVYELVYDDADHLTAAVLKSTEPTPRVLKRQHYVYDAAGNRTAEQVDDSVRSWTYNNMSQLVTEQAGGALLFKGTLNEPATVTVGGRPARVTAENRFEGQTVVPSGPGEVAITAQDPSGSTRTNTYRVTQAGAGKNYSFDSNGNMVSDGVRTFAWDAENRLARVMQGGTDLASFQYNAGGIRTQKVHGGATTRFLVKARSVIEERLSDGSVTRHFQGPGIDEWLGSMGTSGVVTYYVGDHLGSIRQGTNAAGQVVLTRDYDPWGSVLTDATTAGWAFTGRDWDPETALYYYRARYYDPGTARFLSEDPLSPSAWENRYGYVGGNPVLYRDPTGEIGLLAIAAIVAVVALVVAYVASDNVREATNLALQEGAEDVVSEPLGGVPAIDLINDAPELTEWGEKEIEWNMRNTVAACSGRESFDPQCKKMMDGVRALCKIRHYSDTMSKQMCDMACAEQ